MKKDNILVGLKYGIICARVKKVSKRGERKKRKLIIKDLKHAGGEILDYLKVRNFYSLDDLKEGINEWLALEAKMTEREPHKYEEGKGEYIFNMIALERAIYYKGGEK